MLFKITYTKLYRPIDAPVEVIALAMNDPRIRTWNTSETHCLQDLLRGFENELNDIGFSIDEGSVEVNLDVGCIAPGAEFSGTFDSSKIDEDVQVSPEVASIRDELIRLRDRIRATHDDDFRCKFDNSLSRRSASSSMIELMHTRVNEYDFYGDLEYLQMREVYQRLTHLIYERYADDIEYLEQWEQIARSMQADGFLIGQDGSFHNSNDKDVVDL